MTSIHARIPPILRDDVFEAKRRGDAIPTAERDDRDQRPSVSIKSLNSSSFDTRKQPYLKNFSRETFSSPRSFLNKRCIEQNETSDEEIEDEICASKENDPSQSPSPVISQSPRKSIVAKRPLSDLPTSTNPDFDYEIGSGLSTSERNIINNKTQLPPHLTNLDLKQKTAKLADRSRIVSFTTCNQQDVSNDGLAIVSSGAQLCDIIDPPPAKRHCSGEGKENAEERYRPEEDASITITPVSVDENAWPNKLSVAAMRKPSSSSVVNKGVRPRAGLRRL